MRPKVLFSCPSQDDLANEILASNRSMIRGEISWKDFKDGWPNLRVLNSEQLADTDVIFLADFSDPAEVFRQLAIIYALPSHGINSLKVILSFFPTGTMDRVDEDGQVVTAKTLARMLSVIPPAACPTQIIIFDIHALQEQFYFSDQVRVRLVTAIDLLFAEFQRKGWNPTNLAIAFPDDGARKRYGRYFKDYDLIIFDKIHLEGDKKKVTIKEGKPGGKHVIIIDDLMLSGETLHECCSVTLETFADGQIKSLNIWFVHPVCPEKSYQRFDESSPIEVHTTNSYPKTSKEIEHDKKFFDFNIQVHSLEPLITKIINQ